MFTVRSWETRVAMLCCVALFFSWPAAGQKPKGGTTPVTATFRDDLSTPDRIVSDGLGPYVNGASRVKAYLQSGAHFSDFVLNLTNTKGDRRLTLDFRTCTSAPTDCSPPFPLASLWHNTVMQTRAANLPLIEVGNTVTGKLEVAFSAADPLDGADNHWLLQFSAETEPLCPNGSDLIHITRTASDTWLITAGATTMACLTSRDVGGAGTTRSYRGNYQMPFQVIVKLK